MKHTNQCLKKYLPLLCITSVAVLNPSASQAGGFKLIPDLEKVTILSGNYAWDFTAESYEQDYAEQLMKDLALITRNNASIEGMTACREKGLRTATMREVVFGKVLIHSTHESTKHLNLYTDQPGQCSVRWINANSINPWTSQPWSSRQYDTIGRLATCVASTTAYCVLN